MAPPVDPSAKRDGKLTTTPIERLRLLALVLTAASAVPLLPALVAGQASAGSRLIGAAAVAALTAYWIRGYRAGRFARAGEPLEAAGLVALGLAVPLSTFMLPLLALIFRCLYGSAKLALARVVAYSAALELIFMGGSDVPHSTLAGRHLGHLVMALSAQSLLVALRRQGVNEATLQLYSGFKHHALYTLDTDFLVTSWNDGAEAVLGRTSDEIMGRPVAEFLTDPDDHGRLWSELAEADALGSASGGGWYTTPERSMYLETVTTALTDERGRLRGYARLVHDVTEREMADAALRESRERMRAVVQGSPVTLFALDEHGVCTLYESGLPDFAPDVVGQRYDPGLARWPQLVHALDRALSGEPARCVVDFGPTVVDCSCVPLRTDSGRWGVIGVATDVTARERAAAENGELQARLVQAQRLETVGQLAGGIAHDFNNLLAVILPYAELVQDQLPDGDPVAEDVAQIQRAAERAAQLTRQLLVFSRRHTASIEMLDLNDVLDDMEKLLCRALGEDLRLVTDFERPLWAIEADPSRVEQVLMNLAVNAREAMPGGGTLSIETANLELAETAGGPELSAGPYVRLRVRDTGIGMTPEVAARAFEPFFTTRGGAGTGLGLATVYGIVRDANGHVSIKTKPGEGTLFEVHLPASPDAVPSPAARAGRRAPLGGGEHVLVIEDEEAVGESTLRMLERGGYRATLVSDPVAAMAVMESSEGFDLAVSDVVMPAVRGPALIAQLRRVQPDLPVLYMSGYVGSEVDGEDIEPLVTKPFTADELLGHVGALIQRHALARGEVAA